MISQAAKDFRAGDTGALKRAASDVTRSLAADATRFAVSARDTAAARLKAARSIYSK